MKNGCSRCRSHAPKSRSRREQLVHGGRRTTRIGRQYKIGEPIRDGDANLGAGIMQVCLGLQHIGPLRHQRRRQAERQVFRQLQSRQVELIRRRLVRKTPGEDCKKVAQLGLLFDERRQCGRDLREQRLLGGHIEAVGVALVKLVLQNLDRVGRAVDEFMGRIDLHLHRAHLDRRDHHIGGQGGVGRDHLKTSFLFLRCQGFDRAAIQAKHIGHVRNADLRREEIIEKRV